MKGFRVAGDQITSSLRRRATQKKGSVAFSALQIILLALTAAIAGCTTQLETSGASPIAGYRCASLSEAVNLVRWVNLCPGSSDKNLPKVDNNDGPDWEMMDKDNHSSTPSPLHPENHVDMSNRDCSASHRVTQTYLFGITHTFKIDVEEYRLLPPGTPINVDSVTETWDFENGTRVTILGRADVDGILSTYEFRDTPPIDAHYDSVLRKLATPAQCPAAHLP